jgi:hypothetical protein
MHFGVTIARSVALVGDWFGVSYSASLELDLIPPVYDSEVSH